MRKSTQIQSTPAPAIMESKSFKRARIIKELAQARTDLGQAVKDIGAAKLAAQRAKSRLQMLRTEQADQMAALAAARAKLMSLRAAIRAEQTGHATELSEAKARWCDAQQRIMSGKRELANLPVQ